MARDQSPRAPLLVPLLFLVGPAVTASATVPAIQFINDLNQNVTTVLSGGAPFVTNYKGTHDVTITLLQGSVRFPYTDNFGGASPGNNPAYLKSFVGSTAQGTGDGTVGHVDLLESSFSNMVLQFDFAIPLGTQDHILIADVDNNEQHTLQGYTFDGTSYVPVSMTGWTYQLASGETGILPDSRWPSWNPSNGALNASYGSGLSEPLAILTPNLAIARLVLTSIPVGSGTLGIQVVNAAGVSISEWRSVRMHASVGALPIVLNPNSTGNNVSGPTVESRSGGIQKIEVDFNGATVALVNPGVISVVGRTTTGGSVGPPVNYTPTSAGMSGNTLVLTFTPGQLVDQACYTITVPSSAIDQTLPGDNDVQIRALDGDATSSGVVNLSDAICTQFRLGVLDAGSARFDMNMDGSITNADALYAKSRVASPARQALCP